MEINRHHIIYKPNPEGELSSYLALQYVEPVRNRYRSYLIRINTVTIKDELRYFIVLAWGRIGVKKRRLSYLCRNIQDIDRLLKPVLRTRLRHGYRIVERGERFPEYEILSEFQKGQVIESKQLAFPF